MSVTDGTKPLVASYEFSEDEVAALQRYLGLDQRPRPEDLDSFMDEAVSNALRSYTNEEE